MKSSRDEARQAFGSNQKNYPLKIEQYIEGAKHIEAQIVADEYGTVQVWGLRDCSLQKQFQKLLEATYNGPFAKEIKEKSKKLAENMGIKGICTFEFFLTPEGKLVPIETNWRKQVEHSVTDEEIPLQGLKIAKGEKLLPRDESDDGTFKMNLRLPSVTDRGEAIGVLPPGVATTLGSTPGVTVMVPQMVLEDLISNRDICCLLEKMNKNV